jgi:hypothetical protein
MKKMEELLLLEIIDKMPCSKYKSKKQRGLCFLTNEWTDFSRVKKKSKKKVFFNF